MTTDPRLLLTGYANDSLEAAEQRRLAEAALADQEIFDAMVGEETWRHVLRDEDLRQDLLDELALSDPAVQRRRSWLVRARPAFGAAAALAAAALAFVVIRPMMPTEPPTPGQAPAAPPAATRSIGDLTPKSLETSPAPISRRLELSYSLERRTPSGVQAVVDYPWAGGEQLRVRLRGDDEVSIYLFARSQGDDVYGVLFPERAAEERPRRLNDTGFALPWLVMDSTPDDEELILVVTTSPWEGFKRQAEIPAAELDALLATAEEKLRTLSWRRTALDDRVRLEVAEPPSDLALVLRLMGE